ncbi:MAG TPA: hypothetical protein VEY94_09760 [Patescibacteria group bacterium]|nr:hypothetical protein [Patescibacteria group bacterium]
MSSLFRLRSIAACAIIAWGVFVGGCGHATSTLPGPDTGVVPAPGIPSIQIEPQSLTVPKHVANLTEWQQSGIATQVPALWMAQWVTYAMIGTAAYANAFHAAGGKYAVAYSNANYWYTSPTYTAPGHYAESAFAHTSGGARVTRPQGTGKEEYLNPNSSAEQSGYAAITSTIKSWGAFNYIYVDGVSSDLSISLYRFTGTPVEITTDSEYVAGMKATMAKSYLPTIINGYMNGNPVQEEEYVGATNIAAIFGESCFTTYSGQITGQKWTDMADALLYTTGRHYPAICVGKGALADNRALRNYWLSSWWLTYDPTYSVAGELMTSPGDVYVFAEQELVPTSPLQTATSAVSQLKRSNGVYAREFATCYLKGVSIGACAAVVNPTSSTLSIPALSKAYHRRLVLDDNNLYDAGNVYIYSGLPTLGPDTGQIIFP